jgi:hypothetical protein
MSTRYAAHYQNRTYYFCITLTEPQELRILMYNTPYTLILKKDLWENATGNQMSMTQGLINAVAEAVLSTGIAE